MPDHSYVQFNSTFIMEHSISPGQLFLTLHLGLLLLLPVKARSDECPCTWWDDNRIWRCEEPGEAAPTQCWQVHEDVRIIQFSTTSAFASHDLKHENLLNLEILELNYATEIADDALTALKKLWYLDMMYGRLTKLPDLSSQTLLTSLDASHNRLTTVPSLTHMTKLSFLDLHHNMIHHLPDHFLPASSGSWFIMSLANNILTEINASSIVQAPQFSSFTFDHLNTLWATQDQRHQLIAKEFVCNIDLESIIVITDSPTNP